MKKWCVSLFVLIVVAYTAVLFFTAWNNHAEGFDGYSFLGQSWRLTESGYEDHFYEPARARTFVAVLAAFNAASHLFSPSRPPLHHYHALVCLLTVFTILGWTWAVRGLVSASVAMLTGVLLFAHYLFFTNGTIVLADVFSATLWAIFFGVFWRTTSFSSRRWIFFGVTAAFIATTKYGHFFFLPLFLFAMAISQRKQIPWKGMGLAALAHLTTIEVLYRLAGGWNIGFWYPLKMHLALHKEYLPSGNATSALAEYLAGRRWLYFEDLLYAYGWPLLLLVGASLLFLLVLKKRPALPWNQRTGIFFFVWALLVTLHQVIAVKETRYFIPFLPALALGAAILLYDAYSYLHGGWRWGAVLAFLVCLSVPLTRLQEAKVSVDDLAEDPGHRDIPRLFAFLKKDLRHHKACEIIYVCDRAVRGLRLDRNVYGVHLPGKQIERVYCPKESVSLISMRENLAAKTLDEFNEEVCFVSALSSLDLGRKPPATAFRPLAIQVTEQEAKELQENGPAFPERIRCEKTATDKFDCYLTRRFFAFG